MAFARPTLAELVARTQADLESRLPGADTTLRRSVLGVLARVFAGIAHMMYGFFEWLWPQLFVRFAEAEYLDQLHGSKWGIARTPAAAAAGLVTFTGVIGSTIAQGTLTQRADGRQYRTLAEAVVGAGGTVQVASEAVEPAVAGNATGNTPLSLVVPVRGVTAAVAATGFSGGADVEKDDAYRARILERIQEPPHGGNKADYIRWAKQVPGVTRAWVQIVEDEPGHKRVVLRFVMDNKTDSIIPTVAEVAAVQTHIDADDVRPVTAEVTVVAPVPKPINPAIQLNPATVAVKEAVEAELQDLLRREAAPGVTILLSHIREAISTAAGEADHVLTSPMANFAVAAGEIATLGDIEWS